MATAVKRPPRSDGFKEKILTLVDNRSLEEWTAQLGFLRHPKRYLTAQTWLDEY